MKKVYGLIIFLLIMGLIISASPLTAQEEEEDFVGAESGMNAGIFFLLWSQRNNEGTDVDGTWDLKFNDYLGSTRHIKEYESVSEGFQIDFLNYKQELDKEGNKYLFFKMRSLEWDDMHLSFDLQQLNKYDFNFELSRLPHRLEHIDRPYINDLNPQDGYLLQNTAVNFDGKVNLNPNFTVYGGYHQENISGTCQLQNLNFNSMTGGSCVSCHSVNSQTQNQEHHTGSFNIGTTINFSPITVNYQRTENRFNNEAPMASFDYGPGFGTSYLSILPNSSLSKDVVTFAVTPYEDSRLIASYMDIRRENLRTEVTLDSQKFKTSFSTKLTNNIYLSSHYMFWDSDNSLATSISRSQHDFEINSTIKFTKGYSMVVGYRKLSLERTNGDILLNDSNEDILNLKFKARPLKTLRFLFDFTHRDVENPFYDIDPTDQQEYRFMSSWQPVDKVSLVYNYYRVHTDNDITNYTSTRQFSNLALLVNPTSRLNLNFRYGHQQIESNANLLYGFQSGGATYMATDIGAPFFVENDSVGGGASYSITDRVRLFTNLLWSESDGYTGFGSYPSLTDLSQIDIEYSEQQYGIGYQITDDIEMSFVFQRDKYLDKVVTDNSGRVNSYILRFTSRY